MLLRMIRLTLTSVTSGALALSVLTGDATAAPGMTAGVVPSLTLCVSPGVLFGVAFTAPMAMLLVGFVAVIVTDRAG